MAEEVGAVVGSLKAATDHGQGAGEVVLALGGDGGEVDGGPEWGEGFEEAEASGELGDGEVGEVGVEDEVHAGVRTR